MAALRLSRQTRYFGDTAYGFVADLGIYLGIERQIDVDARAEFDKSHVILYRGLIAGLRICDDAPRYRSGHLAHEYFLTVQSAYHDCAALVIGARFRQIGRIEPARVMTHELDGAVDRKPVGMYVENRHEH